MGDTAYLADGQASPQHTFFDDTLYVSNDPDAYNTLLITALSDGSVTENDDGCAVATVRSGRDRRHDHGADGLYRRQRDCQAR